MTKHPSFKAQTGKTPKAGEDYSEDKGLYQDDYEHYVGTGRYSDEPKGCTQQVWQHGRIIGTVICNGPAWCFRYGRHVSEYKYTCMNDAIKALKQYHAEEHLYEGM